jgi:hypothetical protein
MVVAHDGTQVISSPTLVSPVFDVPVATSLVSVATLVVAFVSGLLDMLAVPVSSDVLPLLVAELDVALEVLLDVALVDVGVELVLAVELLVPKAALVDVPELVELVADELSDEFDDTSGPLDVLLQPPNSKAPQRSKEPPRARAERIFSRVP